MRLRGRPAGGLVGRFGLTILTGDWRGIGVEEGGGEAGAGSVEQLFTKRLRGLGDSVMMSFASSWGCKLRLKLGSSAGSEGCRPVKLSQHRQAAEQLRVMGVHGPGNKERSTYLVQIGTYRCWTLDIPLTHQRP